MRVQKALEMGYDGRCLIIERRKVTRSNKTTGFEEVTAFPSAIPCRLSFSSSPSTTADGSAAKIAQTAKLFLAPNIEVKEGSKITVTQNGVTTDYKRSGKPAVYATHQEIVLELFDGWA